MATLSSIHPFHRFKQPNYETPHVRELNWMGHVVKSIRTSHRKGIVHQVMVTALAIFASFVLVMSVIGSPLFIYGFKEYVTQNNDAVYEETFQKNKKIASDHIQHAFLAGRALPYKELPPTSLVLDDKIRKEIQAKLGKTDNSKDTDSDLLAQVALIDTQFISKYGLKIVPKD